jgi:hypothetical protein
VTGRYHARTSNGGRTDGERNGFVHGVVRGLQLAAAPTFAVMAMLIAAGGGGASDILCAAALDASPLTGMVPMYVLMSIFHAAPWLRLLERIWHSRSSGARPGNPRALNG